MNKFETLEKAMCKELEMIEQKIKGSPEMNIGDLDKIDKLVHALKSLATYKAMKEAEEYEGEMGGYSGARGRSPSTGRYVSRDAGSAQSYADGYSQGYSEAMRQSGRRPEAEMPPYDFRVRY